MKMTIPLATARIGREMATAHTAIDTALVATTALLHSTATARADNPQIEASLGQTALLRLHKSLGELLSVRSEMMRAHKSLREDITVIAGPDEPYCPPSALSDGLESDNAVAA